MVGLSILFAHKVLSIVDVVGLKKIIKFYYTIENTTYIFAPALVAMSI